MQTAVTAPLLDTSFQTTSAITVKPIKLPSSFGHKLNSAKTTQQGVCNKIKEFPRDQQLILISEFGNATCSWDLNLSIVPIRFSLSNPVQLRTQTTSPSPEPTLIYVRVYQKSYCFWWMLGFSEVGPQYRTPNQ